MSGVEARSFDAPDETRTPDKAKVEIVRMGGTSASRMSLQPGWRWSESIRPVAGAGHDAWVVGDEPVGFEFESRTAEEYAKGS